MQTEKKLAHLRYGVDVGEGGVRFKPGTSSNRPVSAQNGLTRLNSDTRSLEFKLNDEWFSLAVAATGVSTKPTGEFIAVPNGVYALGSADTVIKLPDNAKTNDTVILADVNGSFSTAPVTVLGNGKKIQSTENSYLLDRGYDAVCFTFVSASYGWSVLHSQEPVRVITERFSGSNTVSTTSPTTLLVNTVTYIDLASHQTATLIAEDGEYGDELHIQALNASGSGSLPAAQLRVAVGSTLNGVLNYSTLLNGRGSWIKLKYLDGWKIIGQSVSKQLISGKSLTDPMFLSPGKYYIDKVTSGLPLNVPKGTTALLEVKEGRGYSGAATVTSTYKELFIPSLNRLFRKLGTTDWEQLTPFTRVAVAADITVVPNSEINVTVGGDVLLTLPPKGVHGDRIRVTTSSIEGSSVNLSTGQTFTFVNQTVELLYSTVKRTWYVTSDTHGNAVSEKTLNNAVVDLSFFSVKGRSHLVNVTGDLPYPIQQGTNELLVETFTRESFTSNTVRSGVRGYTSLYDTVSTLTWTRPFNEVSWTGSWRSDIGVNVKEVALTDELSPQYDLEFNAVETLLISRTEFDSIIDVSTGITNAKAGDRLVITNKTKAVITLTGASVTLLDDEPGEEPNTISGEGSVSFYVSESKGLVIVSSVKR